MQRLDAGDLERVGRFVAETGSIEGDEPFPTEFLAAIRRLVPCDSVTFCELDRIGERALGMVSVPEEPDEDEELGLDYWEARHEHPICRFHEKTGDWRAYRLSDFVETRRFRRKMEALAEGVRGSGRIQLRVHPKDLSWVKGTSNENVRWLREHLAIEDVELAADETVVRGSLALG